MNTIDEITFCLEFIDQVVFDRRHVWNLAQVKSAMVGAEFAQAMAKGKQRARMHVRHTGSTTQSTK